MQIRAKGADSVETGTLGRFPLETGPPAPLAAVVFSRLNGQDAVMLCR